MNAGIVGESIAISAEFENYSSRTVIPYATLHQTQMFFANGKTRIRDTKFTVLTGEYHDCPACLLFSQVMFAMSEVNNVGGWVQLFILTHLLHVFVYMCYFCLSAILLSFCDKSPAKP